MNFSFPPNFQEVFVDLNHELVVLARIVKFKLVVFGPLQVQVVHLQLSWNVLFIKAVHQLVFLWLEYIITKDTVFMESISFNDPRRLLFWIDFNAIDRWLIWVFIKSYLLQPFDIPLHAWLCLCRKLIRFGHSVTRSDALIVRYRIKIVVIILLAA